MFPVSIHFTINNATELATLSAALNSLQASVSAEAPRKPVKAADTKPAPEAQLEKQPEAQLEKQPETKPAPAADVVKVERKDVSAAVIKLATKDEAAAVKLLGDFGVKAVKEVKDEDLPALFDEAKAALAAIG